MKLIKQANGKTTVKMSQSEWLEVGKKAGWTKESGEKYHDPDWDEDEKEQKYLSKLPSNRKCKWCGDEIKKGTGTCQSCADRDYEEDRMHDEGR